MLSKRAASKRQGTDVSFDFYFNHLALKAIGIKLSSTGAVLSGTGFYTGGGLNQPYGIAIDGSGNVWVTNAAGSSVTELVGVATPVITPIAAGLPVVPTPDGTSNLGTRP